MLLPLLVSIAIVGSTAAIVNPPPRSDIHRAIASDSITENAKRDLDQCLAIARLEVPEDYPYADEQPTSENCYELYVEAVDGI